MKPRVYYNDNSKDCCAWLRELMKAGLIAEGEIDSRSITDVRPDDLKGFTRAHFFAGIAGWEYALQLAGWPDDGRVVWTGSCPCQAFSVAGKQKGVADDRDLWPDFRRLIAECRPKCVFGEQVANAVAHGWLDRVLADLEAEDYAVGACVLGAHSVGAPHIRQRLYWVADTQRQGLLVGIQQRPQSPTIIASERGCEALRDSWWTEGNSQSPLPVMVDGLPHELGGSRGFGNAIVPQVAAHFIRAYMESVEDHPVSNERTT